MTAPLTPLLAPGYRTALKELLAADDAYFTHWQGSGPIPEAVTARRDAAVIAARAALAPPAAAPVTDLRAAILALRPEERMRPDQSSYRWGFMDAKRAAAALAGQGAATPADQRAQDSMYVPFNPAELCSPTLTQCPRCNNPHNACDKFRAPAATPAPATLIAQELEEMLDAHAEWLDPSKNVTGERYVKLMRAIRAKLGPQQPVAPQPPTELHALIDKALMAARRDAELPTPGNMAAASKARTAAINAALAAQQGVTVPPDVLERAALTLEGYAWRDGLMIDPDAELSASELRAMLASPAAQGVTVPPGWAGWVLVPMEPTEEMRYFGGEATGGLIDWGAGDYTDDAPDNLANVVYRAMLAASPAAQGSGK